MSYLQIPQNFYQMLQPNAPWHAGAEGWTKAPWPNWGNNPNLVGQPRLGVGQEASKPSLLPLLLGVAGIVGVLVLAGGALGASAAGPKYSPRHRANRSRRRRR
jgi:hypothetical protein